MNNRVFWYFAVIFSTLGTEAATAQQIPAWAKESTFVSVYESRGAGLIRSIVRYKDGQGTYELIDHNIKGNLFNIRYYQRFQHPNPINGRQFTPAIIGEWSFQGGRGYFVFREPNQFGQVDGYWGDHFSLNNPRTILGSWDGLIVPVVQPPNAILPAPQVLPAPPKPILNVASRPNAPDFSKLPKGEAFFSKTKNANKVVPATWFTMGAQLSQAVGQIVKQDGTAVGSCFMVGEGVAFSARHIFSTHGTDDNYEVKFQIPNTPQFEHFKLSQKPILLEQDICILVLDKMPGQAWRPKIPLPAINGLQKGKLPEHSFRTKDALIIGYPVGRGLTISFDGQFENPPSDVRNPQGDRYWYSSGTEEGSSGCPVFDFDWRVVAVHYGVEAGKKANVGYRIEYVMLEAIDSLPNIPARNAILDAINGK